MNKNDIKKKFNGLDLESVTSPASVAFDITSKCNYRCRHCYNNSGDNIFEDMTDAQLLDVARQIAEVQPMGVCLCGGEPLIRGDVVFEIIKIISASCGGVNIVSNGWLVTPEICRKLKESGTGVIQISLDGDTAFTHEITRMMPGAYEKALNAIRVATECGLQAIASFCPNKLNYKYFPDTAELVKSLGGTELRSMPLILMGRGCSMKELQLSPDEYLEFQQIVKNTEKYYENDSFHIEWGDPIDHLYRMPNNSEIGFNSFSMEIRADGKLLVSSYLPIVVGDLKRHSIKEYWEAGYKKIWSNPEVKKYIDGIYSTEQYSNFEPKAYCGKDIEIDLITE